MVFVVAACGGSDDGADGGDGDSEAATTTSSPTTVAESGDSSPDTTAPVDDGGGDAEAPPEVTDLGSFAVNGTVFAVTFLNRCIPFEGPDSDVIDLQPLAQGQGAQLNLNGTNEFIDVSVQGSAINEMFGSIAFGASGFDDPEMQWSIDGDRWTGSGTLNDALDEADPVMIVWDVMIPDEIVDCSL